MQSFRSAHLLWTIPRHLRSLLALVAHPTKLRHKNRERTEVLTTFRMNTCKGNNILDSVKRLWDNSFIEEPAHEATQNSSASHHLLRGPCQLHDLYGCAALAYWRPVPHMREQGCSLYLYAPYVGVQDEACPQAILCQGRNHL